MRPLPAIARLARATGRRTHGQLGAGLLFCSLAFLTTACEHATTLIDPLAGDSIPGDGTVQRGTLTITITVTAADSALASVIGSPGGVLRDAEVTIKRSGSTESPQSAVSDANGRVSFEDLLPGTYAVSLLRLLTPEEVARFGSEDADVNAFGGGSYVTVEPPSTEAAVPALAGRRGSLVVSEHFAARPSLSEAGGWPHYWHGMFIELYNNSDTTIYLDGKVIALGMYGGLVIDHPDYPCTMTEKWRNDPDGIWSFYFEAFPGVGHEYPLAAGEAVVVATDAIDHRAFHAELYDLSRAGFEFIGSSDVDNPSVPNMINIGVREFSPSYFGHGLMPTTSVAQTIVVAEPLDVGSLPVDYVPGYSDPAIHRSPGEKVLDVLDATLTPEAKAGTSLPPYCAHHVHESFDRQRAALHELDGTLYTVQRRVLGTLPDGRVILQRTETSSRDFDSRTRATPGQVP